MSGIAIYMEGGGDSKDTKASLRTGMDGFLAELKDLAREKSWRWKLVCCGGRDQAFKGFINARSNDEATIVVLLVDAEGPVNDGPCKHLIERDGWDLAGIPEEEIHLMIQTMEAWIVADPATLRSYYGQHFNVNALPNAANPETIAKIDIVISLDRATRRAAPKGIYHKIKHASQLLQKIDPMIVQNKCPSCARLFNILRNKLEN